MPSIFAFHRPLLACQRWAQPPGWLLDFVLYLLAFHFVFYVCLWFTDCLSVIKNVFELFKKCIAGVGYLLLYVSTESRLMIFDDRSLNHLSFMSTFLAVQAIYFIALKSDS